MAVPPLSKRTRLPLSRRAALERLPIHLDPAMWKPEELMEVFRTPRLLEMLRADPAAVKLPDGNEISRFDAGLLALRKAGIRLRDLLPRGPEKWLEHGTFLLIGHHTGALGVYRTREHAERARSRIVADLANGTLPGIMSDLKNRLRQRVAENALSDYWPLHPEFEESDYGWSPVGSYSDEEISRFVKVENDANEQADKEVERLFHPGVGRRARKEYAERTTSIIPLPIQLDDKDYAEGDSPTEGEQENARRILRESGTAVHKKVLDDKDFNDGWDAAEGFVKPAIDTVVKRLKMIEEGVDPEKMSDDAALLSGHAATRLFPISKRAQDPVRRTAESILKIINFILFRVPQKDKIRYLQRIRGKVMRIPSGQVSLKKLPQTAAIGQAISLTKNILSGLNPFFVKRVVDELANMMLLQVPERMRRPIPPPMPRPGV